MTSFLQKKLVLPVFRKHGLSDFQHSFFLEMICIDINKLLEILNKSTK